MALSRIVCNPVSHNHQGVFYNVFIWAFDIVRPLSKQFKEVHRVLMRLLKNALSMLQLLGICVSLNLGYVVIIVTWEFHV